jgi:chitinase
MSYDLHGTWDRDTPTGNQVLSHRNTTEIDMALDLFWRNDIDPSSIVLGMGFYGRSFKLSDAKCWKPGCKFSGPGDKGPCTKTGGVLSYKEIMDIIAATGAKPYDNDEAKVNYLVYGQNNRISYDDKKSFQAKIDFANDRGLNGLMMWAIDLDDAKHTALSALTGSPVSPNKPLAVTDFDKAVGHSASDASKCRITDCGGYCNQAETGVGRVKSYFADNCCSGDSSNTRSICCTGWTSVKPDDCYWNAGGGAVKTDCSGKCDVGDIKVTGESYGWKGDLVSGSYDFKC